ncbi:MAG: hypothetical protein J6C19_05030 [Lachnospiraceae bacterium]|nr:hypothetical protein [Lachnospiraceae bacterium]
MKGNVNNNIKPFEKKQEQKQEIKPRWLRVAAAMEYFGIGRNTLDRIAVECDAKRKVGGKIVLYDIQKLDRYISTM